MSSHSPTLVQGGSNLELMWRFSEKSGYLPRVLMTRDWARNPRGRKTGAISQKCPLTSTCAPWHVHAHTHACKIKESVCKAGKQLKSLLSSKRPHSYPSAHWVFYGPVKGHACHFVYLFACLSHVWLRLPGAWNPPALGSWVQRLPGACTIMLGSVPALFLPSYQDSSVKSCRSYHSNPTSH